MEKINFKKQFGQNFIYDTNLLRAIVNDAEINNDNVLEIGVGAGTLTKAICEKAKKVVSYEIDTDLKNQIEKTLCNENNSLVIYKDFLQEENSVVENMFEGDFKVVANLPYYITTPIIFKLLSMERITSITIMVQKEVAERICAKSNCSDYGVLSVSINSIADTFIKRIVNRNMFIPAPNVDSAICLIKINRNKYDIKDFNLFNRIVKSAFNHRRKILISNLKTDLGISRELLEEIFKSLNFSLTIRGEALSNEDFVNLSNTIYLRKQV